MTFLTRRIDGYPVPWPVLFEKIGDRFSSMVKAFAEEQIEYSSMKTTIGRSFITSPSESSLADAVHEAGCGVARESRTDPDPEVLETVAGAGVGRAPPGTSSDDSLVPQPRATLDQIGGSNTAPHRSATRAERPNRATRMCRSGGSVVLISTRILSACSVRLDGLLRGVDERSHIVPEALELVDLVSNRPDEDALHACLRECRQLLGEQFGGTDRETFAEHVHGSVHGGHDAFVEDAVGFGAIVGDVAPHGRNRVREGVGRLPAILQLQAKGLPGFAEQLRRRVVGRCQPSVGETSDATKPGIRAPATNPDRWSVRLRRQWFQRETLGRVEAADERRATWSPQRARSAPIASSNRCQRSEKSRPTAA